jgi:hypothetical protein
MILAWWMWVILGYVVLGVLTVCWLKWRQFRGMQSLKAKFGGRELSWGEYWSEFVGWTDLVFGLLIVVLWPLSVLAELGASKE